MFHRTNFYQKRLTLLGKTTFDRHIKVDVVTAEHLVEKKEAEARRPLSTPMIQKCVMSMRKSFGD
ncbi:MAG: hypothetical protein ACXU9X_06510 [Thermodesulfobacteriota bacterium]